MNPPVLYQLCDQKLWLSAERCIFWEEQSALIVSDLHLGKTGHFRKAGIAVPQSVFKEDLQHLLFFAKSVPIANSTIFPVKGEGIVRYLKILFVSGQAI